jgi:hypothetical protein
LARSKQSTGKKWNKLLYVVPILAVIIAATVYVVTMSPGQSVSSAKLNYIVEMSIQVENDAPNGTRGLSYIIPSGVGEAGLSWYSHTYDSDGLSGRYPLYMDAPTGQSYPGYSIIHVVSSVNRTYTLGDFFSVWGKTLGQNDTLNLQSDYSANGLKWSMCVGQSMQSQLPGHWGKEPLVNGYDIVLLYDRIGCL